MTPQLVAASLGKIEDVDALPVGAARGLTEFRQTHGHGPYSKSLQRQYEKLKYEHKAAVAAFSDCVCCEIDVIAWAARQWLASQDPTAHPQPAASVPCPTCGGPTNRSDPRFDTGEPCPNCDGYGEIRGPQFGMPFRPCRNCHGTGVVPAKTEGGGE